MTQSRKLESKGYLNRGTYRSTIDQGQPSQPIQIIFCDSWLLSLGENVSKLLN